MQRCWNTFNKSLNEPPVRLLEQGSFLITGENNTVVAIAIRSIAKPAVVSKIRVAGLNALRKRERF